MLIDYHIQVCQGSSHCWKGGLEYPKNYNYFIVFILGVTWCLKDDLENQSTDIAWKIYEGYCVKYCRDLCNELWPTTGTGTENGELVCNIGIEYTI